MDRLSEQDNAAEFYKMLPAPVKTLLDKLPVGGRVLDFGGGSGVFVKGLHKVRPDLNLFLVDWSDVADKMPDFVHYTHSSIESTAYEAEFFDLVFCNHVFEHLLSPVNAITEMYRILKKSGAAVIITPYYKTIFAPDGACNFYQDYTHVRPYSKYSIKRMFEENGFESQTIGVTRNMKSLWIGPWLLLKYFLLRDTTAGGALITSILGSDVYGIATKKMRNPDVK